MRIDSRLTQFNQDGRRLGQKTGSRLGEVHVVQTRALHDHRWYLGVQQAAAGFQAGNRGGLLATAVMTCRPGGRPARSQGQQECDYQQDSDSRAMEHALHHVVSVALNGRGVPVM